jgi:hypothetical protein
MFINTSKEYLAKLILELSEEGENKEELHLWYNLYDLMEKKEIEDLIINLEKELEQLKYLNVNSE